MSRTISIATSQVDIEACFPVLAELRPHLSRGDFYALIGRLAKASGFRLAYLRHGEVEAVAGFRVGEWLPGGKYLEIEDLVTRADSRSKGYGGELFDWLVTLAQREGCHHLRLVSGVHRVDAHRFYHRKGMSIAAHYFSLDLSRSGSGKA
jgi:GNAT superfamily N-acetyltransferase